MHTYQPLTVKGKKVLRINLSCRVTPQILSIIIVSIDALAGDT